MDQTIIILIVLVFCVSISISLSLGIGGYFYLQSEETTKETTTESTPAPESTPSPATTPSSTPAPVPTTESSPSPGTTPSTSPVTTPAPVITPSTSPEETFLLKWTKGKCLAVDGGKNENGTSITTWDCNKDDPNQQFKMNGTQIQWIKGNKCLNIFGGTLTNETPIKLWECNNDNNNKFVFKNNRIYAERAQQKDEKKWKNCTTWDDAWEGKQHHDWCQKEVGEEYRHTSRTGDGCSSGFGYGLCSRPAKCLNIKGGKMDNNTPVILFDCNDDDDNNKITKQTF